LSAFRAPPTVFGLLRSGGLLASRVITRRLCPGWVSPSRVLSVWRELADKSTSFLRHFEKHSQVLQLTALKSAEEIANAVLAVDSPVFTKVNEALRRLPIDIVWRAVGQFTGFLSYVCLIQGAIELFAEAVEAPVFCGLPARGSDIAALYCSAVGQVVVWPAFTSASREAARVISDFVRGGDGILFEITLGAHKIAAPVGNLRKGQDTSEVLIAAASLFRVDAVEAFDSGDGEHACPVVRLTCVGEWSELQIERNPRSCLMVEE
jgi:hypothetical protein